MRDRHVRHIAGVDSTGPWLAADGPFYPVVVQVCGPDVAQARAKECTPHSDHSLQFADQDTRRWCTTFQKLRSGLYADSKHCCLNPCAPDGVTDSWKAIELVRAASRESKAGDRPRAQRRLARTRSRSLLMPSSWLARFGRRGSRCHLRLTGRHPSGIGNLPNGTFKVGHDLEP